MNANAVVNLCAYYFVTYPEDRLESMKAEFKAEGLAHDIKGTILLTTEGININLAGSREGIDHMKAFFHARDELKKMPFKESFSHDFPYTRMLVRLKKEVIKFNRPEIQPEKATAPHLSPEAFKQWYDEHRDMVVLDTRNDYEISCGAFDDAIDLDIRNFHEFPEALQKLPEDYKEKPIVTYCTGGVRCEKAAQYMLDHGFKEVYQLDGGILNYFKTVGGEHYHDECFVFDKRITVNSELKETETVQCFSCRHAILPDQQREDGVCPRCEKKAAHG